MFEPAPKQSQSVVVVASLALGLQVAGPMSKAMVFRKSSGAFCLGSIVADVRIQNMYVSEYYI